MTAIERVPAAPISVRVRRAVLVAVAGSLYAAGWLAAVVVLAVLWSLAAVRLGWSDARKRT